MNVFEDYELKRHTTFKIGGKAKQVFFPKSIEEFTRLIAKHADAIVLGGCSNVLISSRGVNRKVILTTEMKDFELNGNIVTADCGVRVPQLARAAQKEGLSGFEFMVGFPGTVGGALFMNASAHAQAMADTFRLALVFDRDAKKVVKLAKEDMNFSYRHSVLSEKNLVLLKAKFVTHYKNPEQINRLMQKNIDFRKQKQPSLSFPNAGSIFKNPENDSAGRLLESAGAKNMKEGAAQVWHGHANFILNMGSADSKDVSNLMFKMYNMVKEKFNIALEPEILYLGGADREEDELWDTMLNKK